MKKSLLFALSLLMIASLVLSGCGALSWNSGYRSGYTGDRSICTGH